MSEKTEKKNGHEEANLIIVAGIFVGGIISLYTQSVIGLVAGSITGIVLARWYKKKKKKE
ncbi:hypothetical protein MYX07_04870 [Patescibacteria group bacterium AH-259-L07]|nr:hypothetical protein [Patescibacteria group bacterium AH-259-L07]